MTFMVKRIGIVVLFLMCTMWILSLQRTQSIQVTPVQDVLYIIEEDPLSVPSLTPTSPSPSPSPVRSSHGAQTQSKKSPSVSPTPYTVFIPTTLHVIKERIRRFYYDTTINTPLNITIDQLRGNIAQDIIQNLTITIQAENGTASVNPETKTIRYSPKSWYSGFDSFTYSIQYEDSTGNLQLEELDANIRVRIGVVLNSALLTVPTDYMFSETNKAKTSLIKSVFNTAAFRAQVPDTDTWLNRKYNTCAIVGNGGCLRGRNRGAEIDSHDVVVRINLSPFYGYAEDIGSRIDISFSNGATATNCWKRNETQLAHNITYDILAQMTFAPQFKNLTICPTKFPFLHYHPLSYLFVDYVDSILNQYHSMLFGGSTKKYRSTGMIAVTAMSMICDHVSVYGFERGPHMENNYYDSIYDREWSGHSYTAEKAYFKDLASGGGLFEPFMELYDLYTSFSYIVD